ncbi:MAG: exo-beta-N-acetylmuramidase NamZ domain-containing protein, partial [Myxococcales bacterium]
MVETGLVRAIEQGALKGLRVGAICNPTSVDANLRHLADLLHEAEGVTLAALFGPEHGVRGDVQYLEEVHGTVDPRTGVPEHSLYGQDFASLTPRDEHLKNLDALVFD